MIELPVRSQRSIQAIDITASVTGHRWRDGMLWISCPHTTASLLLGEADDDMLADYEHVAAELFQPFRPFRHHRNDNPNAAAHLLSSFGGTELLLPVEAGAVVLGTYQRIVFLELDGPKDRRVQAAVLAVTKSEE